MLCVVGGNYKNFYINILPTIKSTDLIIFQHGIIYEFSYYDEIFGESNVAKELCALSARLNCAILASVNTNLFGDVRKSLLLCQDGLITDIEEGVLDFHIGDVSLSAGFDYNNFHNKNSTKILFLNRYDDNAFVQDNVIKNGIILDKNSANLIKNGEEFRKFQKYCEFILK